MHLRHAFIYLLSVLFFFLSCTSPNNKKNITGTWYGAEWLIEGQPSTYDVVSTLFNFDPSGQYTYSYAGQQENGTYYLNGNQLFTTPHDGVKMMVEIIKLNADSMVFNMNRGGQSETLTLVKK